MRPSQYNPRSGDWVAIYVKYYASNSVLTPVQHQRQVSLLARAQVQTLHQDRRVGLAGHHDVSGWYRQNFEIAKLVGPDQSVGHIRPGASENEFEVRYRHPRRIDQHSTQGAVLQPLRNDIQFATVGRNVHRLLMFHVSRCAEHKDAIVRRRFDGVECVVAV